MKAISMAKSNTSIILDTNWYISYVIKSSDSRLTTVLNDEKISIIVSNKLLEELRTKIHSNKFRKYFSLIEAEQFIELLEQVALSCNPTYSITICRDPKDNFLLALAKDSKADFLVTGDNDLLILKQFENTTILTLTEFINHLNKK